MSAEAKAYLYYILSLKSASDQQLQDFIDEREQFILLGSSEVMTKTNNAVDTVFDKIDQLAKQLEEEQIADQSVQLAEDAAAVAAIFSFGFGMAAMAALTVTDLALQAAISDKEDDLYNHLNSADQDIGDAVGDPCAKYTTLVKSNNNYVKASAPTGVTPQLARSFVYNFIEYISSNGGATVDNFRKYIEVADMTESDPNIDKTYAVLDEFALSDDKGADAIADAYTNLQLPLNDTKALHLIRGVFTTICVGMKIAAWKIRKGAAKAGIPPEEYSPQTLEALNLMSKAVGVFSIMISVADAFLNVYNIINTVERYEKNVEVFAKARQDYKDFYQQLYDASVEYNTNAQ